MVLNDSDWWLFWTTLIGAVVGSAVGGLISYVMARQTSAEAADADHAARTNAEKAQAFRVFFKLSKIDSNLRSFHDQIEAAIAAKEKHGITGPLCAQLDSFASAYPQVSFNPDELAIFVAMGEYAFVDLLMAIEDNHNTFMDIIEVYSQQRGDYKKQFGEPVSDPATATKLSPQQLQIEGPERADLNDLAEAIRSFASDYFALSVKLIDDIGPKFRAYFKDETFLAAGSAGASTPPPGSTP